VHGSQFGITLGDMHHLAGTVTVLGKCADMDVVVRIAEARASGKEPLLKRVIVEER
jgi:cyclophilin family peptidyl-prolyl cis-trans isomerase